MALNAGVLSVTVEFAKGLKDADLFSKIDPYAVLKVGSQTFRTRALQGAGTSPVWNATFNFNVINENNLEITISIFGGTPITTSDSDTEEGLYSRNGATHL